jgi:hypothetical protein
VSLNLYSFSLYSRRGPGSIHDRVQRPHASRHGIDPNLLVYDIEYACLEAGE